MKVVFVLLSAMCACAYAGVPYYGGVSKGTPAKSKSYKDPVYVNKHNGNHETGYDNGYPLDYGKGYQAVKPVYGTGNNGGYGNRASAYAESMGKGNKYGGGYDGAYAPVYHGAYGKGYVSGYGYRPVNGAVAHAASVGNGRAYAAAGQGSYYGAPRYGPVYLNGYGNGYGNYGVY